MTTPSTATQNTTNASSAELATYSHLVAKTVACLMRRMPMNVLREDLVTAGMLGLMDALKRHTGERDAKFEWYARVRIRGAIIDELRREDWLTRDQRRVASGADGAMSAELVALDEVMEGRFGLADAALSPHAALEIGAERRALMDAMKLLPTRDRKVLEQRFFEGRDVKDIAAELGVSAPRVSQLLARAIGRLRELLQPEAAVFGVAG